MTHRMHPCTEALRDHIIQMDVTIANGDIVLHRYTAGRDWSHRTARAGDRARNAHHAAPAPEQFGKLVRVKWHKDRCGQYLAIFQRTEVIGVVRDKLD